MGKGFRGEGHDHDEVVFHGTALSRMHGATASATCCYHDVAVRMFSVTHIIHDGCGSITHLFCSTDSFTKHVLGKEWLTNCDYVHGLILWDYFAQSASQESIKPIVQNFFMFLSRKMP